MRLLPLLLLAPAVASASGFYLSENGGKALMMGGAFAGEADDLSAIQHNPAGLSQLRGFHFLVDAQLVWHNVGFQRLDANFDLANPPASPASTSNKGAPFPVPMLGLGYGFELLGGTLFIGGGVYGPPAEGKYVFPTNYAVDMNGKYLQTPKKYAPQRYTLIDNNILVIFPTVSVAYAPIKQFSFGVSLQPVIASFEFSQAVTSIDRVGIHPMTQADENPFYDSVVRIKAPIQYVNFTAVIGALVAPTDWLQFGVSFRPQVMINATGELEVEPGQAATALMTHAEGKETTLSIPLPAELKVGVHVKPIKKLGINFDFIYQGWQVLQEIVLDPKGVALVMGSNPPVPIAPFRIQKHWQPAYSFRLGASYELFPWLSLYLGGWYETGAIPDEYIGVDFLHFARVNFTGGVGLKRWGLELLLGAAGSPSMTRAINNSKVVAGSTEPDPPPIVGNGIYTSSSFMLSLGIRGHFGGGAKPAPAAEPAPAPASEPAPAPAPAPSEAPKS